MLSESQLQARRSGIGGSDIAAIMELSPWSTPLDVYLDKLGITHKDLTGNSAVEWGNRLEDVVAEKFSDDTGLKVRRNNQLLKHKELQFCIGNIDRQVLGRPMGMRAGLEIKTTSAWSKPEMWGPGATFKRDGGSLQIVQTDDQVPVNYLCQCAWYMAVTDSQLWFLSVLIGGNDFRTYTVFRNRDFEHLMLNAASDFWINHVQAKIPPPPSRPADVERLYPIDDGCAVPAPLNLVGDCERAKQLQEEIKSRESELKEIKGKIKMAFGSASRLVDGDRVLATWKAPRPSVTFDRKALEKESPDIYQKYLREVPSARRLLIK